MEMQVQQLHPDATIPTFAHDTDAGMDLHSVAEVSLEPGERMQIPIGIAIAIPEGYVGLIWDKSGISHKKGLKSLGGVIDAGYRGQLFVALVNVGDTPHTFHVGDKVAQLLIQKIERPTLVTVATLEATPRGDGAFGSTGT